METVVAHFVRHVHHNHHTNSQTHGQTGYIDDTKQPLFNQVTPCDFYIIEKHNFDLSPL